MNPDDLLNALKHYGVKIKEYSGWRTHNRGPLDAHVIVVHDTVTGSMSDQKAAEFCKAGRLEPPLKGPLYECLIGRDGTAHLIGFGRSNHGGRGREERFMQAWRGRMPLDAELGRPGADDYDDANAYSHGIAFITYGAGPYTPDQVKASAKICAAYCRAEGWDGNGAGSMIAHGEFSSRKIDPALNMSELRSNTHSVLIGSNEVWYGPTVSGDTLWGIANRYGVTVQQIKDLNNLQGDVIGVGWRLRVK